ncbi:MAG TPA: SdrD B-like domain-containing protein, partial [Gemmatimonadales bacterium]|nr:SdrD B-like domain-containing protein [Gemmatimonadales bacterium]
TYVVDLPAGGLLTIIGANISSASATLTVGASISGRVFEDVNYGGGAGRSLATSGGVVLAGARVELYNGAGAYVGFTTTDGTGAYTWPNLAAGSYTVRVVNLTVPSSRGGYVATLIPVQTYRTDASSGIAVAVTDRVGGQDPDAVDAGNGGAGTTMNTATGVFSAGISGQAQSIAPVTISGAGNIASVDFGFSFDVMVNRNTSGQGSLRQVITNANALANAGLAQAGRPAGTENAIFMLANGTAFPGTNPGYANQFAGGVATINLTSALPSISSALVLDAQTQPGWSGVPIVELDGSGAGGGGDGFTISSANNVVSGFIINRFGDQGIILTGAGATGNVVAGNYIGVNASGTAASANGSYGIQMLSGASNNTIGGTAAAARNVISGNGSAGIRIRDASSTGNVILGNYVGLNAAGTGALGNAAEGILINSSAGDNIVGGTGAGAGNRIWYNGGDGVVVTSNAADGNAILGNSISSNTGLGIDLGNNGVTTNNGSKATNQPNDGMDHPV